MERRDGIRRHFQFDWETVARHNPAYAAFVMQERARLGEDHPLFVTQYLLRPLPGGGRLFGPAQRELLRGAHPRLHAPQPSEDRRAPAGVLGYVAGLDVGGEAMAGRGDPAGRPYGAPANDWTVLSIARVLAPHPESAVQEPGIEVVEHTAWQGASHAELTGGLARLLRDVWRVRRVVIDATGVGEGLASALAALRGGPAVGVSGAAPPSALRRDQGVPADLQGGWGSARVPQLEVVRLRLTEERKSALGYGLLAAVNSGRLRLYRQDGSPEYRALWRELELARAAYRPNRRLAWFVDPADGHDDFLMSLALTVEAARDLRPRTARGRTED